jgi:hypothetical protein
MMFWLSVNLIVGCRDIVKSLMVFVTSLFTIVIVFQCIYLHRNYRKIGTMEITGTVD